MNPEMVGEFYGYINEREKIRLNRLLGYPAPWTSDEILQTYRFTNVRRVDDRTTREFRSIYTENWNASFEQIVLNAAINRCIGTFEFSKALGWQKTFDPKRIISLVRQRRADNLPTFTGAYIITNQGIKAPKEEVVTNIHLSGIWERASAIGDTARRSKSYKTTHHVISTISGFGGSGFMAKEVCLDLMLTSLLSDAKDRFTWSPAGPGAQKGLNFIHGRDPKKNVQQSKALEEMQELLREASEHTNLSLSVSDIQWNLCEASKYWTIKNGGKGKRKFSPRSLEP